MFRDVQEQKRTGLVLKADLNHKASEQARREVIRLVEMDTYHRLSQAIERSHFHHRAWLEDWCRPCAFAHTFHRAYAACDFLGTCSGRLGRRYLSLINAYLPSTFESLWSCRERQHPHNSLKFVYVVRGLFPRVRRNNWRRFDSRTAAPCTLHPAPYKKIPGSSRSADSKVLLGQ